MLQKHKYSAEEYPNYIFVSLITLISLFGIYFRLDGLGNFPFSIDEYYFYSAVQLTLNNGLPEFLCGGFYIRGILLQYISAPFIYFIDNQQLAARLPIVLFSALSFPAIYLIGRDSHSRFVGVLALFLFSFSIWQIEFARFARMYVPFQMIFLWQVWLFIRPDFPSRSANIILNGFLACTATLFYAGGIFCVALAFLNIAIHQKSFRIIEYTPAFVAASLTAVFTIIPFRHLSAEHPFPTTDYLKTTLASSTSNFSHLPIDVPSFLSFTNNSVLILIPLAVYILIVSLFLYIIFTETSINFLEKALILITAITLLLNQFLFAASLVFILLLVTDNFRNLYQAISNKIGISFLLSTCAWALACILYFLSTKESFGMTQTAKVIFNNFFSYPDIFHDVVKQWLKPMPNHSLLSILSILIISIIYAFSHSPSKSAIRHILAIFIAMLLLVALINTPYGTSRYTFFLSPLVTVFFAYCIIEFTLLINNKFISLITVIILTATLCYASEDYHLNHLYKIDSYEINHRKVYGNEFNKHLYPRYDYYSIANFLNKNAKENDLIIITTPVIEHYLNPTLHAEYFMTSENPEFINHSICNGQKETWSELPLIHSYENLRNTLNKSHSSKWIILHGERGNPFSTPQLETLKNKLQSSFVFENPDKSLIIYKLPENRNTI